MSLCVRVAVGVVVLALGWAGAAGAQPFSGVVVFGDSLSDSGNLAVALDFPVGLSLTTNPDPVAAEIVADALGRPVLPSLAGGTNFAWVGACVNPAGPCLGSTPSTAAQIAQHLSATGGQAAPDALYSVSGGANDVIAAVARGPARAAADAAAAGAAYVRQIGRLQDAGAGYVVVYNLPDLGAVPAFAGVPAAPALSAATGLFNDALATGLGTLGGGVVPIDVFGLFNELRAEPGRYDLTNVTGAACAPPAAVPCGPAGAGFPGAYAPGANADWLFADGLHPTGVGHAILAEVVLSTLAAPVAVSLAGEAGVRLADNHGTVVYRELLSDLQFGSAEPDLRAYAAVQYGEQDFALDSVIEAARARVVTVTLGANHRAGERLLWGGALTYGTHGNQAAAVRLDSRGVIGSVHAALDFGGGYVHGAVSGGVTELAVGRDITLGQPAAVGFFAAFAGGAGDASAGGVTLGRAVRTETGSLSVRQLGTEGGAGWMFGARSTLRHGPFAGVSWLQQDIPGYEEAPGTSTSMHFSGFERGSLVGRAGYQIMAAPDAYGGDIRPFGRVAYNAEAEDDGIFVTAGSNRLPGRFTMQGFVPPGEYWSADVGVSVAMDDRVNIGVAYTGYFTERHGARYSFSAAAGIAF